MLSLFFLNRSNQRYQKNISFSADVIHELNRNHWPGNIRQLENVIERIVILSDDDFITTDQIEYILKEENSVFPCVPTAQFSVDSQNIGRPYTKVTSNERELIINSLQASRGNKTQAAINIGMTPRQLYYRIKKLEIEA